MIIERLLKLLLFVNLMSLAKIGNSQASFIEGQVKNIEGNRIIYSSVGYFNHAISCLTDSLGRFKLKKVVGDSIKINALGYRPKILIIDSTTNFQDIILEEDVRQLQEVIVNNRKKTKNKISLGFYNKDDDFLYSYFDIHEEAVFIENSEETTGYIDEIRFRISNYQNTPYALRIRLYNIDTITKLPKNDLLFEDNDILPRSIRKANKYSIKDKNILIPKEGVFVSFQWILLKEENQKRTPYILGNKKVNKSYVFSRSRGLNWKYLNKKVNLGDYMGFYVPSVSITVSY